LKKFKSEKIITKVPFLSDFSKRKYEDFTRQKSMDDVYNSFNEMNISIDSASKELNDIWTKKISPRVAKETDERL